MNIFKYIYRDRRKKSSKKKIDGKPGRKPKFTLRDFCKAILDVIMDNQAWCMYKGKIAHGSVRNMKDKFIVHGLFDEFFKVAVNLYLEEDKAEKLKYMSIDTSFANNKCCTETDKRNPHYANKRGAKISTLDDSTGIPLAFAVGSGNTHDLKLVEPTFDALPIDLESEKYSRSNKHKQYLTADGTYQSKKFEDSIIQRKITPIVAPYAKQKPAKQNKQKQTKQNPKKIRLNETERAKIKNEETIKIKDKLKNTGKPKKKVSKKHKEIYAKRMVIENSFAWIKERPKVRTVYEKTLKSYLAIVKLAACRLICNRL